MNLSVSEELLERIRKIDWFKNCGNPLSIPTELNIRYVNSWKEAKTFYSDQNWENTTLEAGNELTSYLAKNFPDKYNQKWNELVRLIKSSIIMEIIPEIEEIQTKNSLDIQIVNCVKWDILSAVLEDVYKDYKKEFILFIKLLEIYEAGNFPCGWIGTWPKGTLVVY